MISNKGWIVKILTGKVTMAEGSPVDNDTLNIAGTVRNIADVADKLKQLAGIMTSNMKVIEALNKALERKDFGFGFAPALQGQGQLSTIWLGENHPHRLKMIEAMKDYYVDENIRLYKVVQELKEKM